MCALSHIIATAIEISGVSARRSSHVRLNRESPLSDAADGC